MPNEWDGRLHFAIKALEKGVDVLIATPGRLMDIFVDAGLLAVVFSKNGKKVHRLNFDPGLIHRIPETWNDPVEFGQLTAELYRQLWQPFGRELSGPEIRIIPDGILFNLSFEMLTPEPVDNFGADALD